MRKELGVSVLVGIGLVALWSLWQQPISLLDVFKHPISSFWGTHKQLDLEIVEISEHIEPASRRLLKPFGQVRLIKAVSAPADTKN